MRGRESFNPRPSSLTGEHTTKTVIPRTTESFQSTPVITDGRTRFFALHYPRRHRFQSTPVITDGRTRAGVGG